MTCKKRKGLDLRRGIAIFLMLLLVGGVGIWPLSAKAFAADSINVKFTYTKKIKFGNYHTHDFKVVYGEDTNTAFCLQPKLKRLEKKNYAAIRYDKGAMRKLMYYSYGYPGYESKTASYFAGLKKSDRFKGEIGAYVLCHRVLSYEYDTTSAKSKALHKLNASEKKFVKSVYQEMKSWPDPPLGSELSLDQTSVKAELNKETGKQETPEIKLNADPENTITVQIPDGTSLVKRLADGATESYDAESVKSVTIAGNESFKLIAPAEKEGNYKSDEMQESQGDFHAYLIKSSKRQDMGFGLQQKRTVAFEVQWEATAPSDKSKKPVIKTSASERESGSNEFTANGTVTIIDKVSYSDLNPDEEYTVIGKLMDKETGEAITGTEGKIVFTPKEPDGTVEVKFEIDSSKFVGKSLVIFEKLFSGEELIASHEDLNDTAQTITIKEEQPTKESTEKPSSEAPSTEAPSSETPTQPTSETPTQPSETTPSETPSTVSTLPDTPAKAYESSPMTGDEAHVAVAFLAMAVALLAIGCCIVFRKSLL